MAKKKRAPKGGDEYIPDPYRGSVGGRKIIKTPAFDEPDSYRFTAKIRNGKQSSEVFCRKPERRKELGLPAIIVDPS